MLKIAEDLDSRCWIGDNLYSKAADALREAAAVIDAAEKYRWLLDQDYEVWKVVGWDIWQPDPDMGHRRDQRLTEIKSKKV
jgi:hypothetical protein